jgi:hypothetical protein
LPCFGPPAEWKVASDSVAADILFQHKVWQASQLQQLQLAHNVSSGAALGTELLLPGVVLVKLANMGWGNRLPSIVTGKLNF